MRQRQVGLAVVGAVIGAGFASGREVMRFFTQYGSWAYAGVAVAALGMGILVWQLLRLSAEAGTDSFSVLCEKLLGKWGGRASTVLYGLMLAMSGAAMLSGAGELSAIVVPVRWAYPLGFGAMLLCALLIAQRGLGGLAWSSAVMIPLCVVFDGLLLQLPVPQGIALSPPRAYWEVIPLAVGYAALNISLAAGLLCEAGPGLRAKERRGAAVISMFCLGGLLLLANAVLMPHAVSLRTHALPMVALASGLGTTGFYLSAVTLAMAMLTTMATTMRGLYLILPPSWSVGRRWGGSVAICALLGMVGFTQLVGTAYPALGWCAALLIVALCWRGKRVGKKVEGQG